jgi:hypothetical protein
MKFRSKLTLIVLLIAVTATIVMAQRYRRFDPEDRQGVPVWNNEPGFEKDVFTFTRIQYDSGWGGRGRGWGGGWRVDYRDADLNFSFRLQQLTSLKVDPEGKVLRLTDPELFDHPFIYIVEPGALEFSEDEVKALRRYLLNGGFLMVDDFWGDYEWQNLYEQIKRVFPDREPEELPLEHPIFHCVFDLKEKPQIPNFETGEASKHTGVTWESRHGPGAETPHYRAIHDDKGRMMVIICHNTDLADGWEREGVYEYYFREFSEKKSYPLGINIVFYAMTN